MPALLAAAVYRLPGLLPAGKDWNLVTAPVQHVVLDDSETPIGEPGSPVASQFPGLLAPCGHVPHSTQATWVDEL